MHGVVWDVHFFNYFVAILMWILISLVGYFQLEAPRRHCCDILPSSSDDVMEIKIRECEDELIAMLPIVGNR